ncbi:MAG: glycine cleavage system protein GcvH [Planctomycetaceae bacterium]|nr:glycine cleavage system protein GcvH [Planctomycetaceae bacterium]
MAPPELRYAKSHEWVKLEGGVATVGITDFATKELTDLVYLDLPKVGRKLKAGEIFGVIESVKSANDLYSPVAGEVTAANTKLPDDLATLSADPFGKGWLIQIKVSDASAVDGLMDSIAYDKHCRDSAH